MNANTIRPIEVNDRAEVTHRNPDNGEILNLRGTVVDITNGIAILDLDDDGGNYSTPVEALERVEQVYVAGGNVDAAAPRTGRTIARRDNAPAGEGTAVAITVTPNGVEFDIHDADRPHGDGRRKAVLVGFGDAADITAWLHDQLHNPANDYSAHTRPAADGRNR